MKQIICPAEKGVMSTVGCLACSLNFPPPCGYSYTLLKAIYAHEGDRSGEVHVTDITGCLLKSYWSKVEPSPELVQDKLVKFLGQAVHEAAEDGDKNVRCELPIKADGIVGCVAV